MSSKDIFAYIPARGGSKRLPRKNIKNLGGVPVLARVIEQLNKLDIAGVVVSTEDDEIAGIAKDAGAETLAMRAPELAQDTKQFMDLIKHDVPRYCDYFGTPHVLFVLATAALVRSQTYVDAIKKYFDATPTLLLSTTTYPFSPYWGLTPDGFGGWRALFPEIARLPSEQHPEVRVDAGAFYVFNQKRCQNIKSVFEAEPLQVFDIPQISALDIDTHNDWEKLEDRYQRILERNA